MIVSDLQRRFKLSELTTKNPDHFTPSYVLNAYVQSIILIVATIRDGNLHENTLLVAGLGCPDNYRTLEYWLSRVWATLPGGGGCAVEVFKLLLQTNLS